MKRIFLTQRDKVLYFIAKIKYFIISVIPVKVIVVCSIAHYSDCHHIKMWFINVLLFKLLLFDVSTILGSVSVNGQAVQCSEFSLKSCLLNTFCHGQIQKYRQNCIWCFQCFTTMWLKPQCSISTQSCCINTK